MNSAICGMTKKVNNEALLRRFIDKFELKDQQRLRAVRTAMRKRLPTANELVYDNYNFFAIGYSATERPSDSIVSIAAKADGLSLFFLHGARLNDPARILLGSGKQTRFVRLAWAIDLERPTIETLLSTALEQAKVSLPTIGRGKLIIRSVSAKQRPRKS